MVYFECQKCNETIKKPKLAKHLQHCQSAYVSCIDCSKVFAWDEWEAHTSCMSEAQKYQGKLFQAKESTNKGQKKQDAWIENVQRKIADPSLKSHVKSNLEKLLGFDNIPRKQKPFGNFVKNSLKLWDNAKINELWEVISAANAAPPPNNANAAPPPATATAPPAVAVKVCQPWPKKQQWQGWKRALDDELQEAGGQLPWKRLRDNLVARYREGNNGENGKQVELESLAHIPDSYLSKEDEFVRIPTKQI
jgi:cell growth-regulating nucleolar protein